jgi:hypothetical protein
MYDDLKAFLGQFGDAMALDIEPDRSSSVARYAAIYQPAPSIPAPMLLVVVQHDLLPSLLYSVLSSSTRGCFDPVPS